MSNFQAFLLGLVQGVAEFLPISSSGHTTLLQMFFGIDTNRQLLNVLLHLATLIVILVVYRKAIWRMIRHPFRSELKWLILATLPAVVYALLAKDRVEALFPDDNSWLGYCFLFTSFIMLVGEAVNRLRSQKHKPVQWFDAVIMGCMQIVGSLPGVSRSGSTISGGMISGLSRRRSVNFSFLMAIPAILGSAALEAKDIYDQSQVLNISVTQQLTNLIEEMGGYVPLLISAGTAIVIGFIAIKLMLYIVKQIGLRSGRLKNENRPPVKADVHKETPRTTLYAGVRLTRPADNKKHDCSDKLRSCFYFQSYVYGIQRTNHSGLTVRLPCALRPSVRGCVSSYSPLVF